MTHKEFYFWLEGYLHGRLEGKQIPITPIVEKMNEVKDIDPFFPEHKSITKQPLEIINIPTPKNPINIDDFYV